MQNNSAMLSKKRKLELSANVVESLKLLGKMSNQASESKPSKLNISPNAQRENVPSVWQFNNEQPTSIQRVHNSSFELVDPQSSMNSPSISPLAPDQQRSSDELNQSQNSNSSINFLNESDSILTNNSSEFEFLDLSDKSINFARPANLEQWLDMFHGWTHDERLNALESLVNGEICDIQQIRFLLSIIEPQLQRDFISLLPKELALYVLSFLEPKDLCKAAQTCRYWRILCEDNLLWREKCREYGLNDEETLKELFRKRAVRNARNVLTPPTVSPIASPSLSNPQLEKTASNLAFNLANLSNTLNNKLQTIEFQRSDYKLAYLRQRAIEHNWRFGRFPSESDNLNTSNINQSHHVSTNNTSSTKGRLLKEILHLRGHDDHVITCLQFNASSNIIVSGSDDNTLKVWSSLNGSCLKTLTGHSGGVWSSQLSPDNIVVSGSTDRSLKIWNALTGNLSIEICSFFLNHKYIPKLNLFSLSLF